MHPQKLSLLVTAILIGPIMAQEPPKPGPIRGDEPVAKAFSAELAGQALDSASLHWTKQRKCGTCHTNYPYLLARPALGGQPGASFAEVNTFFEQRVKNWDRGQKGDAPLWDTEVVATAATLAMADSRQGKLRAETRQALDLMWTLQKPDGAWDWLKCGWPPVEHDDYFGAVYAMIGVSQAPEGYAQSPKARAGLEKLSAYLKKNPPAELHHRAMLLWAATRLDGLMSADEKAATLTRLREAQRPDGGWNLASLGRTWTGNDGRKPDLASPSDAYATGLVVLVLREAGVPVADAAVVKGADWLLANQRQSGRWFTQSLNNDRHHYIANAGSAYAVLALEAAGKLKREVKAGE